MTFLSIMFVIVFVTAFMLVLIDPIIDAMWEADDAHAWEADDDDDDYYVSEEVP